VSDGDEGYNSITRYLLHFFDFARWQHHLRQEVYFFAVTFIVGVLLMLCRKTMTVTT